MSTETAIGRAGTFMFDRHAEAMPRQALAALQASRVKDTLERAYALAHYRGKFDAAGVRPADFKSLADIGRFPFTLKSDLRDNYPFGMFAVPRERLPGCTPHRGRRASPRSSAIPRAISARGRT
jgi:phenylacetate-CoA ligase